MTRCHLTWTSETENGVCPECGGKTILLVAPDVWDISNKETATEAMYDGVSVNAEVTGHFCEACYRIRSVSVNVGDG